MRLDLYWIPLGAGERPGQSVVRVSGWIFETLAALIDRRPRQRLFHSALIAASDAGTITVEMAPIPGAAGSSDRGVVAMGPVGVRWLRKFRIFRYEVRCWPNGEIPDLAYALASPVLISDVPSLVQQVLESLSEVPTPVWGRDELRTGEMWNSNSVIAWALARSGLDGVAGPPPENGRAPGWDAGLAVARSQHA